MNLRETDQLRWKHFSMPAQFDHPISLWSALLDGRADGHVDLLYRWDPNSACPLHRHTCAVSSLVLEGELTVVDIDPETHVYACLCTLSMGWSWALHFCHRVLCIFWASQMRSPYVRVYHSVLIRSIRVIQLVLLVTV